MIYLSRKGGIFLVKDAMNREMKRIDKNQIVQAAIELLQEEGLDKLTMRRLAEKLDIKGASLYWHIKNKNELLELISDEVCKQIQPPPEDKPYDEQLLLLARRYRQVLLNIRDSAHILAETPPTTPYRIDLIKRTNLLLERIGFRGQDIFSASWLLNNYVVSFVLDEYRIYQMNIDLQSESKKEQNHEPKSQQIEKSPQAPDKHEIQFSITDLNKEFQFGLEVILEGFKGKLKG